jgi:hypothetical protein
LPILAQKLSRIGDWGGSNLDANSLQSGSVLDAIQQGADQTLSANEQQPGEDAFQAEPAYQE